MRDARLLYVGVFSIFLVLVPGVGWSTGWSDCRVGIFDLRFFGAG